MKYFMLLKSFAEEIYLLLLYLKARIFSIAAFIKNDTGEEV